MQIITVVFLLMLFSCNVCEEFALMNSPEVEAVEIIEQEYIKVLFSAEMEHSSTERAFVLKNGNTAVSGKVSWSGRTMTFYPEGGLERNRSYELSVSAAAEDRLGNSLEKDFVYGFFTGEKKTGFYVTEALFREGVTKFLFSSPVDRSSFYSFFSVMPFIEGSLVFGEDDTEASFVPYRELTAGDAWTVTLARGLCDIYGNCLEEDFEFRFSSAMEEKASLLEFSTVSGNPLDRLEKDDELLLVFDRSVSDEIFKKPLELIPYTAGSCSWDSSRTVCRYTFDKSQKYGTEVTARVGNREFRLCFSGENSVPPSVERVCFYRDFSSGNPVSLDYGDSILFENSDSACFEFTVRTAPDSMIIPVDFLRELDMRIISGNLEVKMDRIETDCSSKGITLIRLFCRIRAGTQSSVLTFSLDSALTDSLGNTMDSNYVMRINSI